MENAKTVRKIASQFGLILTAYDPSWRFSVLEKGTKVDIPVRTVYDSSYDIPDDFMGKVALLMGFNWVFESWCTDEELIQNIQGIEKSIETHPYAKSMKTPPIPQESFEKHPGNKEEFDKINAQSHDFYEYALQQHITYQTDLKEQYQKILDVRGNLRNWGKYAID